MLIEQIMEFESRVPGPMVVRYVPKTSYFHDKTKILKCKSSSALFNAKNVQKAMYLDFLDFCPVTNFNPKNARF